MGLHLQFLKIFFVRLITDSYMEVTPIYPKLQTPQSLQHLNALEYLIHDNEVSVRNQALEVLQFYEICGIDGATIVLQQYGQSLYG